LKHVAARGTEFQTKKVPQLYPIKNRFGVMNVRLSLFVDNKELKQVTAEFQ
jgi:hypothetical protein